MNKKRGILYWLRVILCVCCLGWFFYRCTAELTASAASDSVTLTPAQTLALYGTQIQGLLRTERLGSQIPITFDYAFPLDTVGYMDDGGGFSPTNVYDCATGYSNETARNEIASYFGNCNGLVYIASSTQWGGVDTTTYENYNNPGVQLHCPFTISLSNIAGIQQGILFSSQNYTFSSVRNSYTSNQATWLFNETDLVLDSLKGNTFAGTVEPAVFSLPTYQYYSSVYDPETGMTSHPALDLTQEQKFAGWYLNTDEQEENFSIRGLTIDAFGVQNQSSGTDLWIIVCCPTLYAYEPPVITTTVPAETIPAATYPVETMPPDVTDVPLNVINKNLVTNNYQLNLIIGQLNLIYAELKAQGQLGLKVNIPWDPDLLEGEDIYFYGTDIEQQMQNIMTTYTLAGNPELNDNNDFVKSAFQAFWEVGWLAALGLFSLVVSLTSWIIFNGRKG